MRISLTSSLDTTFGEGKNFSNCLGRGFFRTFMPEKSDIGTLINIQSPQQSSFPEIHRKKRMLRV